MTSLQMDQHVENQKGSKVFGQVSYLQEPATLSTFFHLTPSAPISGLKRSPKSSNLRVRRRGTAWVMRFSAKSASSKCSSKPSLRSRPEKDASGRLRFVVICEGKSNVSFKGTLFSSLVLWRHSTFKAKGSNSS